MQEGLTDDLRVKAEQRIGVKARQAAALKARQPKQQNKRDSWTPADLLPLLIAGALVLAVGVLAFGGDDEEDEEGAA